MNEIEKKQRELNIDEALNYKLMGLSYEQIGNKLDVHKSTAYRYVKKALDIVMESYTLKAERVVAMELAKLDRLEIAMNKLLIKDKTSSAAVDKIIKIMERRAKFLALDAPSKSEVKLDTPENRKIQVEFIRTCENSDE